MNCELTRPAFSAWELLLRCHQEACYAGHWPYPVKRLLAEGFVSLTAHALYCRSSSLQQQDQLVRMPIFGTHSAMLQAFTCGVPTGACRSWICLVCDFPLMHLLFLASQLLAAACSCSLQFSSLAWPSHPIYTIHRGILSMLKLMLPFTAAL